MQKHSVPELVGGSSLLGKLPIRGGSCHDLPVPRFSTCLRLTRLAKYLIQHSDRSVLSKQARRWYLELPSCMSKSSL